MDFGVEISIFEKVIQIRSEYVGMYKIMFRDLRSHLKAILRVIILKQRKFIVEFRTLNEVESFDMCHRDAHRTLWGGTSQKP